MAKPDWRTQKVSRINMRVVSDKWPVTAGKLYEVKAFFRLYSLFFFSFSFFKDSSWNSILLKQTFPDNSQSKAGIEALSQGKNLYWWLLEETKII